MEKLILSGVAILLFHPLKQISNFEPATVMPFLSSEQLATATDLKENPPAFSKKSLQNVQMAFDRQDHGRQSDITAAADVIRTFLNSHPDCRKNSIRESSLVITALPYGFDGRTFKGTAVLNLYSTERYSPVEFKTLFVHEWIHLGQEEPTKSAEENMNLKGLLNLYYEGQATFGAHTILPELSVEEFLGWKERPTAAELDLVCHRNIQDLLKNHSQELFSGNSIETKPRLGYWIGYQIFDFLSRSKSWCSTSFQDFKEHFVESILEFKNTFCPKEAHHAQSIRL